MADKEGKGQIKINFVSFEVLKKLNDIGPELARQICRARRITNNKLIKEDWALYNIWDAKNIIRHFEFSPNPEDKQLEPAEFEYKKSKKVEQAHQTEVNDSDSDDDSKNGKLKTQLNHEHDKHAHGRERTPNIPKQLHFDGSENFQTFLNKFRSFCDYNTYNDKTALFCLGMTLRGSASKFFEHLRQHGRVDTLTEALNQLNSRFGNSQGIYAKMLAYQNARQKAKESEEEFAERLSELAYDAYPEGDWDQMEQEVSMKFMAGLCDPKARAFLSEHSTKATMEDMTDKLERFRLSKKLARPDRGFEKNEFEVRNIDTEDSSEEEDKEATYEANRLESLEQRVKKIEEKVNKNTEGLSEMMKKMQRQLDRMESCFPKDGGDRSLGKTPVNGVNLNQKESH